MDLRRSERNCVRRNYFNLHNGIYHQENESVYNMSGQDYVALHPEEEEFLDEVNPSDLQELLEDECEEVSSLEEELRLRQLQEEEKRKKEDVIRKQILRERLDALRAVQDRKALLKRALAGEIPLSAVPPKPTAVRSNPTTPVGSPEKPVSVLQSKVATAGAPTGGEYNNLLASVLQLKDGNLGPFAELMSKSASSIRNSRDRRSGGPIDFSDARQLKFPNGAGNSNPNREKSSTVRSLKADLNNVSMFNSKQKTDIASVGVNASINTSAIDAGGVICDNQHLSSHSTEPVKAEIECPKVKTTKTVTITTPEVSSDSDAEFQEVKYKRVSKKKSGILAKPDESDIVKPVKYPHELLDDRHVKGPDKLFAKLSFSQFCAGEIELILRNGITAEERTARLNILKTICYHHSYLDTAELKSLYHATMIKVERAASNWSVSLAEQLHGDLAFRASVMSREKERKLEEKSTSGGSQSKSNSGSNKKSEGKIGRGQSPLLYELQQRQLLSPGYPFR